MNKSIAKVVFNLGIDKEFDYYIPPETNLPVGSRVWVEFNRKKRVGIVTEITKSTKVKNVKSILAALDKTPCLDKSHIAFARFLKKEYPYALGELTFMMVPQGLRRKNKISQDFVHVDRLSLPRPRIYCIKHNHMERRFQEYKDMVAEALTQSSVVVCFPLVSYLKFAQKLFEKNFPEKVITVHSYQKEKELLANWIAIKKGRCLLLGTKLALFYYPLDLSLIIIEEENNPYHLQPEKPFYNLVDIAYFLSQCKKVNLVLSADYPSLKTFKKVKEKRVELIEPVKEQSSIEVLTTKSYLYKKTSYIVHPLLLELLRKHLEAHRAIVILYTRGGSSSLIKCVSCGHIYLCPHCLGFLRFSSKEKQGVCFRCNYREDIPNLCRECNSGYVKSYGVGIERLTAHIRQSFPQATIRQVDEERDTTDIMLVRYAFLDTSLAPAPKVDIGFVIDCDAFLSRIDFEAAFKLYCYVRRFASWGLSKVYVFTERKGNYLWKNINKIWYNFYERELHLRKEAALPPYRHLAKLTLRGRDKNSLFAKASSLYNILSQDNTLEAFAPMAEVPFKVRGKFYYSIVVKGRRRLTLRYKIEEAIGRFHKGAIKIAIMLQ